MTFGTILPKSHPVLEDFRNHPLFFLAGPILGSDDWQADMTALLRKMTGGDCLVVNPSRYNQDHPLYADRMGGNEDFFESQTVWERHYLKLAGESWNFSCVIFWLPEENVEHPRDDGQPYARDTRGEISEWRFRLAANRARVVMGAEPSFPGLSVIKKNSDDLVPGRLPVLSSMEEVATEAVHRALSRLG